MRKNHLRGTDIHLYYIIICMMIDLAKIILEHFIEAVQLG